MHYLQIFTILFDAFQFHYFIYLYCDNHFKSFYNIYYSFLQLHRIVFVFTHISECIYDHRLRGSASTVLTATGQVNGRWRNLTPHRIETHEPTATKFRTFDYVREGTP